MHLICPGKFCITFVFHFSWVLQPSQEKLKTMLMQNFGGQIRCIMGNVEVAYKVFFVIVTEDSLLKDLMEELDVFENVCELLNQKQYTNRVKNWRHLGRLFNFEKETLDYLPPSQEENVCPTGALIQHLGALDPDSKLEDLIWAIHLIGRDDALEVLDVYLEGD